MCIWDNFKVGSEGPATFELVIQGQVTISASDVTIDGLYLTNPEQTYGIYANSGPSGIRIANNRIQNLGGDLLNAPVKAIYLVNGPDNVVIDRNQFVNLPAAVNSVDAINFGDSNSPDASAGVLIQNNLFANIVAVKGAYGIKLN